MSIPHPHADDASVGIAYLIGRLHRLLRRRLGEALSPLELTVQQYTVLSVLGRRGQLSNAQLAERAFVTPQTANELVKAMEANAWIERSPHPRHGRVIQLDLTPRGREVLTAAHAATAELEAAMVAALPAQQRRRFQEQLKLTIHALGVSMIEADEA